MDAREVVHTKNGEVWKQKEQEEGSQSQELRNPKEETRLHTGQARAAATLRRGG